MKLQSLHIGTAGFSYAEWKGRWYPRDLAEEDWLEYYARSFSSVQINSSFYRLPTEATLQRWREQVPDDFIFSFKAPRVVTHLRRLQDSEEPLARMFQTLFPLGQQLGLVLYQLPPRWKVDLARLEQFLALLPAGYGHAFEFRDSSWHCAAVRELLRSHRVILCQHDHPQVGTTPDWLDNETACLRLHGPPDRPRRRYDEEQLVQIAAQVRDWRTAGKRVFVSFNNDLGAAAAHDAAQLRALLADR